MTDITLPRDVAEQVLTALESMKTYAKTAEPGLNVGVPIIAALRSRLAQPEHSCVACEGSPKGDNNPCDVCGLAQPEQESFSPEAISVTQAAWKMGYDAAKAEQPEQEPVAWLYEAGNDRTLHWYKPPSYGTPLYTAPPQRKPEQPAQLPQGWSAVQVHGETTKVWPMTEAQVIAASLAQPEQEPISIRAVAKQAGINLPETYISTMDDAIAAGDSVLMDEQAALLRECRAALDSLIEQKPTIAGLVCGSTTLGNLKAELGAYRPQGVFGSRPQAREQTPQRKPLTDEAGAVINAARAAMDASTEAQDGKGGIKIASDLAASLSLCLDEYDRAIEAAHGIKGEA